MDCSFPKKEHLCFKRRFDELLTRGKSFFIYPYRVIYLLKLPDVKSVPVQVAISVRKKQFKHAVTRNLIKRRFRESWRLNKTELHACLNQEGKTLYILMVYSAKEVMPFMEMEPRMKLVMHRLMELTRSENVQ